MTRARKLAVAFGIARIAYAAALIATPRDTAQRWLGDRVDSAETRVALRGLAARDAVVSAGVVIAPAPLPLHAKRREGASGVVGQVGRWPVVKIGEKP